MDYRAALAQHLTSEKDTRPYDDTVRRSTFTPFALSGYNGSPTVAAPSMLMDLYNAATLPKRVYDGTVAPNDIEENTNFAGNFMGAGLAVPKPANALGVAGSKPKGLTAYHGSPHDFDKFSLDKIGTGEGAQAYGHGLYFAENEAVAKGYRDKLSTTFLDGAPFGIPEQQRAKRYLEIHNGDYDAAIADAQSRADKYLKDASRGVFKKPDQWGVEMANERLAEVEHLKKLRELGGKTDSTGKMYEVNIKADNNALLDWDGPLSQQSEAIKKKAAAMRMDGPYQTGADLYDTLRSRLGELNVSDHLRDAGIPGIRYLDQGSRGAGEGSRNYVVFDDSLVEIMRKYGLAGLFAGGGAMANNGGDQ